MLVRRLIACLAVSTVLVPAVASSSDAATAPTTTLLGTVDRVVIDRPGADDPALVTRVLVQAGGRLLDVPAALSDGLVSGEKVRVTLGRPVPRLTLGRTASSTLAAGPATPSVVGISPVAPARAAGKLQAGAPAATAAATARAGTAATAATARAATIRAAVTTSPIGTHTLTVLPVYWASRDGQTQASLTQLASDTAAYWADQSGGRIVVNPVVKDWAKIADPGSCDVGALFDRALAANGLTTPTSLSQHVMIYFPQRPDCAWAGLGSITGSRIWDNGYAMTDVTAHELGHNFGIGHAQRAVCTAGGLAVPFSSSCQVQEYQDTADIMGFATGMRSGNLNSALADWLGLAQTVTASAAAPASVDLAPLTQSSATRAVKIDVGTGWVYVDFRPATGRDVRMPNWAGVQVHYLPNGTYPQSQLLDLQAGQAPAFAQVSLPAWSVWPVPGARVSVEVTALGSTASVRVVPTGGDTTAPGAPVVTLTRSTTSATSVTASWTAATDSGSGIGAYTVLVDGVVATRTGPDVRQATLTVASTAKAVRVDAVDRAGNVASSSTVAITTASGNGSPPSSPGTGAADTTPPSTPSVLTPAAGQVSASRALRWSWSTSTDAESGVAGYRLYANHAAISGILPGTTAVQISLPEGSTVLGVVAVNGAGMSSPAAESTVVVDTVAPTVPTGLAVAGTTLSWTAPKDTGTALAYQVSLDGGAPTRVTSTSLPITVNAAVKHTWTVKAVDQAGNTSSAATLVTAADTSAPSAPVILTPTGKAVALPVAMSWRAAADAESGVVRYLVTADGVQVASTESLATSVPGSVLAAGRTVKLVVWAVNGAGLRTASAAVTVTVPAASARSRVSQQTHRH